MEIYKNKLFAKWAVTENVTDESLRNAINEIEQDLVEAKLGGYIYKKRLPGPGKGKQGGKRTIVAYKCDDKAIFIYGFAKNKKDNIAKKEKAALKLLAKQYFDYSQREIKKAINTGELVEVIS